MNTIAKESKEMLMERIQEFFLNDRGEEIGSLAAGQFLDFIVEEAAPYFYNQGVEDAISALRSRMDNLEEDLYTLKRLVPKR